MYCDVMIFMLHVSDHIKVRYKQVGEFANGIIYPGIRGRHNMGVLRPCL